MENKVETFYNYGFLFEVPLKYVGFGKVDISSYSFNNIPPDIHNGYEITGISKMLCVDNLLGVRQLKRGISHGITIYF